MNEIIQIVPQKIGEENQNVVSARQLHQALGVKKKFPDWANYNIDNILFENNIDFIVVWSEPKIGFAFLSETEVQNRTPQSLTASGYQSDFLLTLNTAKEIAMMSRTANGKTVRNYFIQVEQEYLELLKSGCHCWQNIRNEGKSSRKALSDSIQNMIEFAFANGSKNAKN